MEISGKIDWGTKPGKKVEVKEEPKNQTKVYEIYFTNGQVLTLKADNDYTEEEFDDDSPILRFYDGLPEDQKIVAIFNLNNIAGYRAISDYISDNDYNLQ